MRSRQHGLGAAQSTNLKMLLQRFSHSWIVFYLNGLMYYVDDILIFFETEDYLEEVCVEPVKLQILSVQSDFMVPQVTSLEKVWKGILQLC